MFTKKLHDDVGKKCKFKSCLIFLIMVLMLQSLIFSQRKFDIEVDNNFSVIGDEVVYSPDGKYYLIRSEKNLTLVEKSGALKWKASIGDKINNIKFGARGNKIYVTSKKGIFVRETETSDGKFSLFKEIRKVQYISTSTNDKFYAASVNRDLIFRPPDLHKINKC